MKMFRGVLQSVAAMALASASVQAEELCSVSPFTYTAAKASYPQLSTAIDTVNKYAIAAWYTDRISSADRATLLSNMLSECSKDTRLSIVVYGLPNKDCSGGFSAGGSVTNTDQYKAFLKDLTDTIGNRKVLYVVEPDALGLLAQVGGCGAGNNYNANLKVAVEALSVNVNAELYIDVGYWMLAYESNALLVGPVMKDIASAGRVKGVTINTSNYRSTEECVSYCNTFQQVMGSTDMHCIIDTSRNENGSPTTDWCNVATAGIGHVPTSATGQANLDYFLWIKVPGESDGYCSTGSVTGPAAGAFFYEGFKLLWDQGYFVKELGMATIDGIVTSPVVTVTTNAPTVVWTPSPATISPPTQAPTTPPPTQAPTTSPPTEAPTISSLTEAPTTATLTSSPVTEEPAPTMLSSDTADAPAATAPIETIAPTTVWTPTTEAPTTSPPIQAPTTSPPTISPSTEQPTTTPSSYSTQIPSACKARRLRK